MIKSQIEAFNKIKAMDKLLVSVDEVAPVLDRKGFYGF